MSQALAAACRPRVCAPAPADPGTPAGVAGGRDPAPPSGGSPDASGRGAGARSVDAGPYGRVRVEDLERARHQARCIRPISPGDLSGGYPWRVPSDAEQKKKKEWRRRCGDRLAGWASGECTVPAAAISEGVDTPPTATPYPQEQWTPKAPRETPAAATLPLTPELDAPKAPQAAPAAAPPRPSPSFPPRGSGRRTHRRASPPRDSGRRTHRRTSPPRGSGRRTHRRASPPRGCGRRTNRRTCPARPHWSLAPQGRRRDQGRNPLRRRSQPRSG